MQNIVVGIFAHVDAGKTTLAESLMFRTGMIQKIGRVDHQDAFLDTYDLEKARGITIFSKQARFRLKDVEVTLVDTPGHIDFSSEMERALQILDYAILVISAKDGIQGHTLTIWRLLEKYRIPTFIFINKLDQEGANFNQCVQGIKERFKDGCIVYDESFGIDFLEEICMLDDALMERYFNGEKIEDETLIPFFMTRRFVPIFRGSALKLEGIDQLIDGMNTYFREKTYTKTFSAHVYKISRIQNKRFTYLKILGGSLKVKDELEEEKVDEIRLYNGQKYVNLKEAFPGMVVCVTGLNHSRIGYTYGKKIVEFKQELEPVLEYQVDFNQNVDDYLMYLKLKELEEEIPELSIRFENENRKIYARVMGEVQIEIVENLIFERYNVRARFSDGSILYKESIENTVEGVGHYEPLRHYAEVHLLLEPLKRGSGLVFDSEVSEDRLEKNWQRLILTHLQEKIHLGVLSGSPITDIKLTVIDGRAHLKHTEGGDFRESTYRAVRQGLMKAKSVLLEPFYQFSLDIPEDYIGKAMSDLSRLYATYDQPISSDHRVLIHGNGPVACLKDYPKEVIRYTRGMGHITFVLKGYDVCHNPEEVLEKIGYDPLKDKENPTGSVFCSHGAGFYVPYDEVENYMHLESRFKKVKNEPIVQVNSYVSADGDEELKRIFKKTYGEYEDERYLFKRRDQKITDGKDALKKDLDSENEKAYLLVDGYNMIFGWEKLKSLARDNLDAARFRLMDILSNYQGLIHSTIILVFDAYKVKQNQGNVERYHNIYVVYTKEAETADQYIEKTVHDIGRRHRVAVATSDGLEQLIILGEGGSRISARGLEKEIDYALQTLRKERIEKPIVGQGQFVLDDLSAEQKKSLMNKGEKRDV